MGGEDGYAFISANRQNTDFLIEGDKLVRTSFLFKGGKKIGKFTIGGIANYSNESVSQTDSSLYFDLLNTATNIPVELYSSAFFKKNPSFNIFEGLQNINGVRPQINCNVCNTGDIRINGLPGPYTMVLIDGMPIVSSLSTVYGLSGIPNSLVERIEIVKGPASSLYGSEAIGGSINIITKNPQNSPRVSAELMTTSWGELNTDLGFAVKVGSKVDILTGINYFNYSNPKDNNQDGFTDMTLQKRISIFQKWNFNRKEYRLLSNFSSEPSA